MKWLKFSLILNLLLIPVAVIYVVKKLQFYTDMKKDAEQHAYQKKNPNSYWKAREEIYDVMPGKQNSIVFMGNSLVDNCDWSELFDKPIINRGLAGDTMDGMLRRVDQVIKFKPTKIFLLACANDLPGNYTNLDTIYNKYKRLVARIKSGDPQCKIHIISELPRSDFAPASRLVVPLNKKLVQLSKEENTAFINVYDNLASNDGRLNRSFSYDGLHMNGEGYMVMKKVIEPYVN
ncbi:GDSL-type esterase/lipase family protein [Mucilaginibacter sp. CSA2-8R]|uniref:GDSL-type esterase/lipase family protein n=1 Tax=Mucilaginibacter sp. CSA2-8R TaxID=3141542 RepID=UPI00315D3658